MSKMMDPGSYYGCSQPGFYLSVEGEEVDGSLPTAGEAIPGISNASGVLQQDTM